LGGLNSKLSKIDTLTHNEKNTIYLTESGFYSLVISSKKPEAKLFKKFVTQKVLPSIRKTGQFSLNPTFTKTITGIENFYNTNSIIKYFGVNVVYFIVIGMIGKHYVIKYGRSIQVFWEYTNHHKAIRDHIFHKNIFMKNWG
jgi:hypothetical protein